MYLRRDPLLAAACDKGDPLGQDRCNPAARGIALAAPSTLNRLELSNNKSTRCPKLPQDPARIAACLLRQSARCLPKHAREVVVDLDAMGQRLHGLQEGRHFSGYYDDYGYLPLYAFVGGFPLWAQLRTGGQAGQRPGNAVWARRLRLPARRTRCLERRRQALCMAGCYGGGPVCPADLRRSQAS
jgi:hypothetical protein